MVIKYDKNSTFKGLLHPKMKIVSSITYLRVAPNLYKFFLYSEHNLRYFWWKLGGLWLSHLLVMN